MKGPTLTDQIRLACGVLAVAALAAVVTAAPAQDSTARTAADAAPMDAAGSRTHTVRAGETLWDIAHTYLGDGDLWPEITRLNHGLVQDPHWIFPNEVLRIPPRPAGVPADGASALAAAAPAASAPAASAPAAPPQAASPSPTAEPSTDASAGAGAEDAAPSGTGTTLFNHPPQSEGLFATARGGALINRKHEGVSRGEHNSAPYMDRDGGPQHAGTVVGVTDVSNVIVSAEVEHYSLHQDIYITMPLGSHPEVGQRFYTYALGESFGDRGQLVEPSGIVTVVRPGTGTVATTARITQVFGEIRLGQGVLPLDGAILPSGAAAPVANAGPPTRVLWVEHNQVLPTIGFFIVLDASAKAGVRLGDQFTLFRPRQNLPESTVVLPESEIAIAQVVRVTPYGSTALVMTQTQPAIAPGVGARVTARINSGQ